MGCGVSKQGPTRSKFDRCDSLNMDDESVMNLACSGATIENTESLLQFPFNHNIQLTSDMIHMATETWELITKSKCEKYASEDKTLEVNSTCIKWFTRK